jgi:hypothetical protein
MTPRSLVGMTMGARKRAALYESLFNQDTSHIKMTTKQLRMVWRNVWPLSAWARSEREKLRKSYRIGQRLRPCPGCHACIPGVKGWHIDKVRGRFKMPTIAWSCDGSGVLPARAKKVRR